LGALRDAEQERVRRRHREAVVVADPDRPVSGRDILQRIDSGGPVRRGQSEDLLGLNSPMGPRRRRNVGFPVFEDAGEGDSAEGSQEEMASVMSFSEVEDDTSTSGSMPSLRSVDGERRAEHARMAENEQARREELESRLGARTVTAEESGVRAEATNTAEQILESTLERALQARERSRGAQGNGE
jgi:hypothetical protein